MLALSVRQPYADQIIRGTKRIEYRTVKTNMREKIYVYASLKPGTEEGADLPRGLLIGTVEVWKCTGEQGDYRWHLREPKRLTRPRRPTGRPQPVWFNPFP